MPPDTFFPMVDRFIKAYQKAEQDLEDWKIASVSHSFDTIVSIQWHKTVDTGLGKVKNEVLYCTAENSLRNWEKQYSKSLKWQVFIAPIKCEEMYTHQWVSF